ncbi:hypothetical protein PCASD_00295 [Puccinia coronata f. sp. avenae]|uniref:Uncharacterized protein n=1 Tax=Puccinia coronata f. sp. avenae TaxID=200324 RepID=A0A2N5VNE9_9BASI|nr:hypothetical protein PCASD_00295 [Puccinia coronata f. sp. avenae]
MDFGPVATPRTLVDAGLSPCACLPQAAQHCCNINGAFGKLDGNIGRRNLAVPTAAQSPFREPTAALTESIRF